MKLKVIIDGRPAVVPREAYVKAKTKQLKEFGYGDLDEAHVDEQITALLEGKKFGKGLTVIGMFMEKEIVVKKATKLGKGAV